MRVTTEIRDHIAYVTLNRPEKMNAVDPDMVAGILDAGTALLGTDARAVVLHGAGDAFCAGLDVASFGALAGGDPDAMIMPRTHDDTNDYQEVSLIWRRIPVPVIVALHGVAFGAGFQIALGADIRIAAPDTKLAIMEMKWGLVPDMGGMVLLPHLTRSDVIRRLTYTAEPILAPRAEQWGLVTELSENPLQSATDLAAQIAGKSPSAIRAAKRLIATAEASPRARTLLAESREQADLVGKPHQMEVIAANLAKRLPKFD